MATQIDHDEPQLPVIEGTPVVARHIVAADPDTDGAVEIVPGHWWAPAGDDGLSGDGGWTSASLERRARDASQLQGFVLPNAAGHDGVLHRDRFRARTDPQHRIGDEWIELVDETTGEPLGVVTTETARADRTTVNVAGPDAAALLSTFREGKVAPWTPHAPQDVLEHYSHAAQTLISDDFRGSKPLTGWANVGGGTVDATPDGMSLRGVGVFSTAKRVLSHPIGRNGTWTLTTTVILRGGSNGTVGVLDPAGNTIAGVAFDAPYAGRRRLGLLSYPTPTSVVTAPITAQASTPDAPIELQVIAIDGWLILLCDGVLAGQIRRLGTSLGIAASAVVQQTGPDPMLVQNVGFTANTPFLRRGAADPDYHVVGAPTPGGLRGDYFLTGDEYATATNGPQHYGARVLAPLATTYAQRLDTTIALGSYAPPPGPTNATCFAVRWSGAIYLDPAVTDTLRLDNVNDMARLWVGPTTAERALIDLWGTDAGGSASAYLAAHLGAGWTAGWYPIVLEYAQSVGSASCTLQRWGGSSFVTVPSTELSPYGCWEGDLGGESFRGAIDSVCNSTGLLWRLQPKVLESGEFPGRLEYGRRLGNDTAYILGQDEATEYASETRSTDAVDRIVADAQGLGDNLGREGLSASMTDPAAVDRPWTLTRAESLTDITEQTLLQQRLSTLMALYGTPAEEIAARPKGQTTLTDRFPIAGGTIDDDALTFRWQPDDGVRCRFPDVGVDDPTPRAITTVTWPLTPQGRGVPNVGFRQRPRHLRETLRRLARGQVLQRRRYQGQLAQNSGSLGGTSGTDEYTRIALPAGQVAKVDVRVLLITGSATIEVNGIDTGIRVTEPGAYDVTAWAAGPVYSYARLIGMPGVSTIQTVATVRI